MNILIAEDLPVTQMLHSKLMHRWGHVFDMASNGAEAVDYAIRNEGKYDLGLLDIEMPLMERPGGNPADQAKGELFSHHGVFRERGISKVLSCRRIR